MVKKRVSGKKLTWLRHLQPLLISLVGWLLVSAVAREPVLAGETTITGTVVKVLDGDSLLVRQGDRTHEVRLWGIDSPEHGQPYGNVARKLTTALAGKQRVKVVSHGRDQYDRILGEVYIEGRCLNGELVSRGTAWVYRRYCRAPVCEDWLQKEAAARIASRGLWRDARPIPPWRWRHK